MSVERQMEAAQRQREELQELREDRYEDASLDRLFTIIERKLKTTMIGAISDFEAGFAHLWGDRESLNVLSRDEKNARRKWESIRKSILDRGNSQIRAISKELDSYTVKWNRNQAQFVKKED